MNTPEYPSVRDLWEERAALWADREFLVHEDPDTSKVERYTYARMDREMKAAASMFASLGVEAGDRVGLHMCNRPEFVECFLALAAIGAVIVPIGPASTAAECALVVEECGIRVLVSEFPEDSGRLEGVAVVCLDDGSYEAMKADRAGTPPPRPEVRPGDLLEIMYTSGTTSRPKGVMFTHANAVFSGKYVAWELSLSEADRYLTTMSVTHVNLQLSALMPAVYTGAALVLVRRYSASRMWSQVRRHRATVIQAMAMIVKTLMAQPVASGERDHSVRAVHYFLPLPKGAKEAFEERYGVRLLNNYGSSETLVGVVTDLPDGRSKWPSIGLAGPGYDVRIAGKNGSALPPGECGEIQVRGQAGVSLMAGYWRDEEATRAAFTADGWFRTGDCGYADAEGWLYFVDRMGDIVKRAGENISACEVEVAILEHPDVADVAVLGISDSIRDEAVKAVVVPKPGRRLTAEDVQDFLSLRLSFFKIPSVIEFRDGLPRGEYGKVLKNQLKTEKSTI